MTDFRALCAEMANELDHYYIGIQGHDRSHPLAAEARAALVQPEPQGLGPTDKELLGIEDLEAAWNTQADAFNSWDELDIDEIVCWTQRQALARWGRPAKPEVQKPTDEELSEFATDWWNGFAYAEQGADVATPVIDIIHPWHFVGFLRDGLARWGRPVVEPVPMPQQETQP